MFSLDDIEDLVISGKKRIDNTGEYDISYYEKYISENNLILGRLVISVTGLTNLIKDEKTKSRIRQWSKDINDAYQVQRNKQPRQEFNNSSYPNYPNPGYFETHKYARFIQDDLLQLIKSYSKIINFMNNVYSNYKLAEKKKEIDSNILYQIFINTKKACNNLGIHSPDALSIYQSRTEDPYNEKGNMLLDFNVVIDENNLLEEDILIDSLPYTITAPEFSWEGFIETEWSINSHQPTASYNKSYIDRLTPSRH